MPDVRPAAVAGLFYPRDAPSLARDVDRFLAAAPPDDAPEPRQPKALVVPHAGYPYSGPVAASAYARLRPFAGRIRRVVLLGPAHRVPVRGLALSGARFWATPLGAVEQDMDLVDTLCDLPHAARFDGAHENEHSLEVQLPFLLRVLGPFQLVAGLVGALTPGEAARALDAGWNGTETLIVISTDLSHFLDYAHAVAQDGMTARAIEALSPSGIGADAACGHAPLGGLLAAARHRHMEIERLDLRNSGDTAGSRDRVVGYGAWALHEPEGEA
ncbi:AmmeMemoRadiSam system protein B [Phaeovibrio sulfidiphilus]|uniref:MEMO1 family protein IHV25_08110 n=1 Tax=Phaeovibrio sulfidiphilus TaxID=1220600 RepID=A0A8J7CE78_9PROT|nr:AmmeMemoRadiSam system protein B [Phaeovibrio sulfidiphilus]MBE1237609.1 AmmeMemoRadiSam system protein B [Phaeovibrio sulfidiphilus]